MAHRGEHRGGHRGGRGGGGGGGGGHHSRDVDEPAPAPARGGGGGRGGRGGGGGGGGRGNKRKKSLLIGINYVGSQHALEGCQQDVQNVLQFIGTQGYPSDQRSQLVMRDDRHTDPNGPLWPTGRNILAAMAWLVSEPNTTCFMHYSGHGGQVADTDGTRVSGFDDTIVPVDYEKKGQIPSGVLHETLITNLKPRTTLFMIFDCCHSGSAVELPYIYRADSEGNVSMMDNMKQGMRLLGAANHLVQGGFSMDKVGEARQLLGGAQSFFKGLTHKDEDDAKYGLGEQDFAEQYEDEGDKNAIMFSGCRDDQTSADAQISGSHVGAMSWAFLETMRKNGPQQTYIEVLQNTRQLLKGRYEQVPQLSVGKEKDLNVKIQI